MLREIRKVNLGQIEDASIVYAYTGPCGDTVKLYLKINGNKIEDAKFEYDGCIASAASAAFPNRISIVHLLQL